MIIVQNVLLLFQNNTIYIKLHVSILVQQILIMIHSMINAMIALSIVLIVLESIMGSVIPVKIVIFFTIITVI